jgi:hypothetical protein
LVLFLKTVNIAAGGGPDMADVIEVGDLTEEQVEALEP